MEELTLHVQRMQAPRFTIKAMSGCSVDALRELVHLQTFIPVERQRLIFRGRVLKNGETLSSYGIEDESVLHLVERPEVDTTDNTNTNSNTSTTSTSNTTTQRRVAFHAMEVDPSLGPLNMASQITQTLMDAFQAAGATSADDVTVEVNTVDISNPSPASTNPTSNVRRQFSRPGGAMRNDVMSSLLGGALGTSAGLLRMETNRALNNLNSNLTRITTLSNNVDLFPTTVNATTNVTDADPREMLKQTLESFERAYWMMASACRELREGVEGGNLPWDRVHNFNGMLQEMPLMMVVQRRLLSTIRSNSTGFELPSTLDVPSILDSRNNSNTSSNEAE